MARGCLPQRVLVPFVLGVSVQKTPCHKSAFWRYSLKEGAGRTGILPDFAGFEHCLDRPS